MKFNEYKGLDLVSTGNEVLERWKKNHAFEKSLELREGAPEFIFFEGPPSANGMPGIHHVMARSIKDAICRYKTQSGYRVERRAGWDTHGLPVELGVEKMLGITKEDIGTKISVEEYNDACRKEVMKYTAEWVNMTERVGYWVDMNDPYITYDNRYIETLWYLLKKIYDKGLLYKGKSIQPYSPAAGTGLSTHELNQPGCYRDVKDTTAVAQFKVVRDEKSEFLYEQGVQPYFLAWTTTPWTLPSNTALCVGPNIDYVRVLSFNPYTGQPALYVVAQALVNAHFNPKAAEVAFEDYKPGDKLVPFKVLDGVLKGSDLTGISYEQLIPWFNPGEGAFKVIPGDYVTTEDGTGIVHIAPTFGADDAKVARLAGVPGLQVVDRNGDLQAQVDLRGRFFRVEDLDPEYAAANMAPEYAEWAGRYVKNAYDATLAEDAPTLDVDICVMLKQQNKAFKIEKHTHNYPHCWRTDKPVLYYPLNSWFIKTTAVRERMMELNDSITWKPESTGTGRFGKWLENIQDWNLSRSRYWGTPLPVWQTEDGKEAKCIGSIKELYAEIEKAVAAGFMTENPFAAKGFDPEDMSKENYDKIDIHRPYVDNIFLVSDSGKKMVRELDLIDVWFDSGAMPYAQEGLRNLGSEKFGCTADFIAEGVDQTRGWFYTLHAINTMVSDKCAFKRVISNGLVLDKFGQKMSKRLGNGIDPFECIQEFGSDPVRWYMITNSAPWDNLKFDKDGVNEVSRTFFGKLFQTYNFFAMYANVDNFDASLPQVPYAERPEIDRWVLSELNTLIANVAEAYEDYEPTRAGRMISAFVMDNLSNWFVRLNRKRFWAGEMTQDKLSAYQTLYTCLLGVAKLMAPIAPFYADRLYLDLTQGNEAESVHLARFPESDATLINKDLEYCMELAQKTSSMALSLRKKEEIIVRQPLATLAIPATSPALVEAVKSVQQIILDEINVKAITFMENNTFEKEVKCNFRVMGKKFGKMMKAVAAAVAEMTQDQIATLEAEGSVTLQVEGQPAVIELADLEISTKNVPGWTVASDGALTVALDVNVTDELRREGWAREVVKRIQTKRKESGFEITDRIVVKLAKNEQVEAVVEHFGRYISEQVLADELLMVDGLSEGEVLDLKDFVTTVSVSKVVK